MWLDLLGGGWQGQWEIFQVQGQAFWSPFSMVGYVSSLDRGSGVLVLPQDCMPDLVDCSGKALPPLRSEWRMGRVEVGSGMRERNGN